MRLLRGPVEKGFAPVPGFLGEAVVKATLAEVARRANVSPATASRVISNSSYGVKEDLRSRVLEAARELGYVPNAHAQALVRGSTSTVGVVVGDVADPYFTEIVRGIQEVAVRTGRLVTVCNTYRDPERELAYVRLLHAQRVNSIILAGSGLDDREYSRKMAAQLDAFAESGGRVALIGRHHVAGDGVVADNVGGARALAEHLIGLGHRRFGVISGPPSLTTTRDRLEGFRGALIGAGVELAREMVVHEDFSREGGVRATRELLRRDPGTTALFAMNDMMALGALAALRDGGVSVPNEVSVVGFDDVPIARDVTPALSTVRVPLVEMGSRAMEMALEADRSELRVEHLPTQLVLRASAAAPVAVGA